MGSKFSSVYDWTPWSFNKVGMQASWIHGGQHSSLHSNRKGCPQTAISWRHCPLSCGCPSLEDRHLSLRLCQQNLHDRAGWSPMEEGSRRVQEVPDWERILMHCFYNNLYTQPMSILYSQIIEMQTKSTTIKSIKSVTLVEESQMSDWRSRSDSSSVTQCRISSPKVNHSCVVNSDQSWASKEWYAPPL